MLLQLLLEIFADERVSVQRVVLRVVFFGDESGSAQSRESSAPLLLA
jgi:hypothetical protein